MNDILELSETSVADLLKSTPTTVRFFLEQRIACVGCSLARFCTLRDVINTYELDEKKFFEDLSKYLIHKSN